jgi:hypothetical protein
MAAHAQAQLHREGASRAGAWNGLRTRLFAQRDHAL